MCVVLLDPLLQQDGDEDDGATFDVKFNDLGRSNSFLVKSKDQGATITDRRHCRNAATQSRHCCFGRVSTRRPSLFQKRRQRNIRLVLKIQNRPVFKYTTLDFRYLIASPMFPNALVCFVVFSFRCLIGQPSINESSPNGMLGNKNLKLLRNNPM